LLAIWCGLAGVAQAADPVCDPDQPTHCSVGLKAGEPVPFDGQLVSPDLAITLGQRAEHCDARIQLEADRVSGVERAESALCARMRELEARASGEREKVLSAALDDCSGVPWWESPPFVAAVTVVVTTAALWGIWYVAIETVRSTASQPASL